MGSEQTCSSLRVGLCTNLSTPPLLDSTIIWHGIAKYCDVESLKTCVIFVPGSHCSAHKEP